MRVPMVAELQSYTSFFFSTCREGVPEATVLLRRETHLWRINRNTRIQSKKEKEKDSMATFKKVSKPRVVRRREQDSDEEDNEEKTEKDAKEDREVR